jgi:LPS export ABC transporter permease LptF/LPS export ABC transporter permease LptG
MANHRLIERYVLRAIWPYILISLILLTAILFAQQTVRYLEGTFQGLVPMAFVYSVALSLLPNVLIFTLPMSVLSGTIIGLGRMGSDSELVAMRAAGVSTIRMLAAPLVLGMLFTLPALYLNLWESPQQQRHLRTLALRGALYKLDSPVEPRTFTTDIPGKVIYVREGDKARGEWGRVFMQSEDPDHGKRLITARSGRIDSSGDKSELVLEDATTTKMPPPDSTTNITYTVEHIGQLRIAFDTGRGGLLNRMQQREANPEQMKWTELRQLAASSSGNEKREATMLVHKRLAFSFAPLVFSLLGASLALRMRRGGRGLGVLLSLLVMLAYYLVTIAGDQMARAGTVPASVGPWVATALTVAIALVLLALKQRDFVWRRAKTDDSNAGLGVGVQTRRVRRLNPRQWLLSFPSLLDISLVRIMIVSFVFGFIALAAIFNIFTVFELWRFIAANRASAKLIAEYLFYLMPLVSVELFPGSVLVAMLVTYALTARRREAVAWWASGQSVYRLMLPGLVFALTIAAASWFVQERIMPQANTRQDALRARIRGNIAQISGTMGRRWLVSVDGERIYSYEFDEQREVLLKPAIYDFDAAGIELKRVISGEEGKWVKPGEMEIAGAQWINVDAPQVSRQTAATLRISGVDPPSVFKPTVDRPSQLSADRLNSYIKTLKARGADTGTLAVALQRKYAGPFSVIVMALIGMPLAISFGRKSTVIALCSAVVVSLAFWLISSGFQQLGEHALLPPGPAVWTPIVIFACSGLYFISRVRT